jgi:hypothetical protein
MALALAIAPNTRAACTNANDSDCDGFLNTEETAGLVPLAGSGMTFVESPQSPLVTNPGAPDLFVILQPGTCPTASFPNPLLNYVAAPVSSGGLGLAVRLVTQAGASARNITASQKAVRVSEACNRYVAGSKVVLLGITTQGDPNGLDNTTVYTQSIDDYIRYLCGGTLHAGCKDSAGNTGTALVNRYIRYVANHEVGHDAKLANVSTTYVQQYNGNHLPPGNKTVMEQSAIYTKKGSNVTFYLADKFDATSQGSVVLHTY